MAEKTIKTKILLRYDVLSAWTSANPELKAGEVAIVAIPTDSKELNINGTTPPQILFKVGPGNFNDLPYASGKAADVYSWAKEASLSIAKSGEGNVVSGIEWDAAANNGKGGIKFTTASVATSEELKGVQDRLTVIEGTGEKSRITLLEEGLAETDQLIKDSKAAWEKDDNTTYTFEKLTKGFKVTPSEGNAQEFTFDYLTSDEIATKIAAYGYKDEAGVKAIVESYGYKNEAGVKSIVEGYGYQTSAQVESAITSKGYQTLSDVETAITSKGYQTADNVNSLIANSTLAGTVAELSEDVATNAGDIAELGGDLETLSGTVTGHINDKENPHGVTAAQVGAYTKEETNALFEPYRTSADQDVIDKAITDDIAGLKLSVGNLGGAFQFKGTVDSVENLPVASTDNAGHVYLVGDLEYASNGTSWIQLGQNGDFVLDSIYQAHLKAQAATDKGQSDAIKAIEDDIKANRESWASKTSVTDPTARDGKITVDGVEMVVYDDSALAGRVSTVEGKVKTLEETTIPTLATKEEVKVERERIDSIVNTTIPTLATKAEVKDAIDNSHTHSNKDILDATTASFTTELKTKYDGYEGSISGVADRVTAVENEFKTVDGTKGKVVVIEEKVDGVIADYLKGADKTELQGNIDKKQDIITDLETIRSGAALGATAVQLSAIEDMLTKTEAAKTYETIENVKSVSDRVKVVEDNFADWAIIWDCGGASNN